MKHLVWIILVIAITATSCRSTRKITSAISTKDTVAASKGKTHADTIIFIRNVYDNILKNRIDFSTFSSKIEVDYIDADGKKNVTAHVRMKKDSIIWISLRAALLGIEGLRVYITPDSVKVLDKQNNTYSARSVEYLQEVTALPLDLPTLQDLLIGNPVFLDTNFVSYSEGENGLSLLSIGSFFKNLFTVKKPSMLPETSKLDDLDELRNRTCHLSYSDYENKKGVSFATKRQVSVAEKKKIDIKLDFKQYDFNETLSFPFPIPKNYKSN